MNIITELKKLWTNPFNEDMNTSTKVIIGNCIKYYITKETEPIYSIGSELPYSYTSPRNTYIDLTIELEDRSIIDNDDLLFNNHIVYIKNADAWFFLLIIGINEILGETQIHGKLIKSVFNKDRSVG